MERSSFGATREGAPVERFVLAAGGLRAQVITLGATLTALEVAGRDGVPGDVVLGFDDLGGYLGSHPWLGSTIGRCAGRIAGARFVLGGREHRLTANEGGNHLHGGLRGLSRVVWQGEPVSPCGVALRYRSPDGEEGYPGNLDVLVTYRLADPGVLRIEYLATADAPTVVNLTHHSYFDLAGGGGGDVLGHVLLLAADRYAPVDAARIPTGELRPTPGTPMDFTSPRPLGAALDRVPGGYDHSYALSRSGEVTFAARLSDPGSGRVMEVHTSEPALQLYTGNGLDGRIVGKGGVRYRKYAGVCLEAQRFPDAPNQPRLGNALLVPGERYRQVTEYRFGAA